MHRHAPPDAAEVGSVGQRSPGSGHIRFDRGAVQVVLENTKTWTDADIEEPRINRAVMKLLRVIAKKIYFEDVSGLIAEVVNVIKASNSKPVPVRLISGQIIERACRAK